MENPRVNLQKRQSNTEGPAPKRQKISARCAVCPPSRDRKTLKHAIECEKPLLRFHDRKNRVEYGLNTVFRLKVFMETVTEYVLNTLQAQIRYVLLCTRHQNVGIADSQDTFSKVLRGKSDAHVLFFGQNVGIADSQDTFSKVLRGKSDAHVLFFGYRGKRK
ncbi:hypothetical protein QE152_g29837 [Popillia japonica]|uniref:Uncharacterized protein n=1 Tax=Popillia japonica TaxID=7064 RepID=A0AAW1JHI6_POPJA